MKRAVALLVLAMPARALADEPRADPAATRAGDANLEPEHAHDVIVTLAAGGSLIIGFGVSDAAGRGGSGSLRLARRMTLSWMLTLELSTATSLHKLASNNPTYVDTATGLMVGGQYHVGPSFWIRVATGLGVYNKMEDPSVGPGGTLAGLAGLGGAGLELARFHHVALGLELFVLNQLNRDGLIVASGLNLDVAIY